MAHGRFAQCAGGREGVIQRDVLDRVRLMFELMYGEEQPAAGQAAGRRRQSRFPKAILERAPLDATCLCHLFHA